MKIGQTPDSRPQSKGTGTICLDQSFYSINTSSELPNKLPRELPKITMVDRNLN